MDNEELDDEEQSLTEEIEQMFREEAHKVKRWAKKTPNLPPGHYEGFDESQR